MPKLKVFFNKNQSTNADVTSFSPSAKKPLALVDYWLSTNQPIDLISSFEPVTREQFYTVHNKDHVDAVLDLKKLNGFYNTAPEIAATLPWTAGSILAAAIYAFKNKTITMSPTSGFHHATQNECMGFCTFNGLMVTAVELLKQGAKKVGILDLDHHYGNGTDSILEYIEKDYPRDHFHHYTVGGDRRFNVAVGEFGGKTKFAWSGANATKEWLEDLSNIVSSFDGCDLVIFQAGADPHVDDPCHALLNAVGALTDEQFIERDKIVFEGLKALNIPIAWNLAGGYQTPLQKVLNIHTQTLQECLKVL